jgi:SepF-like predicted cell division protein (DUF552 family)
LESKIRRRISMTELRKKAKTICSKCGKTVPESIFCIYCGERLKDNIVESTPSPESSIESSEKIYLKTFSLQRYSDINVIKKEIEKGNILFIKITPLAKRSVEEVKQIFDELKEFITTVDGDIAQLGQNRVVITPHPIRLWRKEQKTK